MSFPMAAAGGTVTLLTLFGRKGWLCALFLQAGSGKALTLGPVTALVLDRLVVILGIMATGGTY